MLNKMSSTGIVHGARALGVALLAALAIAGCGGGEPAAAPTADAAMATLRAKGKALAQSAAPSEQRADQLFNFAEASYPGVFPPHEPTHAYYGFYYRYYPSTGVYLGVVYDAGYGFELNGVYATGGMFGSSFMYAGPLSNYVPPQNDLPPMQVGELPFSIVYAATSFGIDARSTSAVTFASDNSMSAYNFSAQEAPQIGTMTNVETSGTQTVQIGRWTHGTFAGRFYNLVDTTHSLSLNANQGFHYAIATIPAKLPCSGGKTYTLAAATRPTLDDGTAATGSVDQMTATVTFNGASSPTVAVSGTVTIDGQPRNFSGTQVNSDATGFSITNVTSQTAGIGSGQLRGTFGGANAAQLGVVVTGLPQNGGGFVKYLNFAARLSQSGSTSVACN